MDEEGYRRPAKWSMHPGSEPSAMGDAFIRHPRSVRLSLSDWRSYRTMRSTHVHGPGAAPDMHTDERTATRVRLLHAIFEQQSRVTPAAVALEVPPAHGGLPRLRLTYAELDA